MNFLQKGRIFMRKPRPHSNLERKHYAGRAGIVLQNRNTMPTALT